MPGAGEGTWVGRGTGGGGGLLGGTRPPLESDGLTATRLASSTYISLCWLPKSGVERVKTVTALFCAVAWMVYKPQASNVSVGVDQMMFGLNASVPPKGSMPTRMPMLWPWSDKP